MVLLIPLGAAIALAIRLTSAGPALFWQERVGLNGRRFHVAKFRTMTVDAERRGGQLTVGKRDPRVTRVGALLRSTKLDELPQLFNVVNGEMRLVGPRPEVPVYVEHYTPAQRAVLSVRPGITDPASVAFRDENELLATADDPARLYVETILPHKLMLNLDYIERRTLGSDLKVIVSTVALAVLRVRQQPRPEMVQE
jgi:lipopolysaccharide/colanic/teichoic acid biosynthesis glycosyltransferase